MYAIIGEYDGVFNVYKWNGSKWIQNFVEHDYAILPSGNMYDCYELDTLYCIENAGSTLNLYKWNNNRWHLVESAKLTLGSTTYPYLFPYLDFSYNDFDRFIIPYKGVYTFYSPYDNNTIYINGQEYKTINSTQEINISLNKTDIVSSDYGLIGFRAIPIKYNASQYYIEGHKQFLILCLKNDTTIKVFNLTYVFNLTPNNDDGDNKCDLNEYIECPGNPNCMALQKYPFFLKADKPIIIPNEMPLNALTKSYYANARIKNILPFTNITSLNSFFNYSSLTDKMRNQQLKSKLLKRTQEGVTSFVYLFGFNATNPIMADNSIANHNFKFLDVGIMERPYIGRYLSRYLIPSNGIVEVKAEILLPHVYQGNINNITLEGSLGNFIACNGSNNCDNTAFKLDITKYNLITDKQIAQETKILSCNGNKCNFTLNFNSLTNNELKQLRKSEYIIVNGTIKAPSLRKGFILPEWKWKYNTTYYNVTLKI